MNSSGCRVEFREFGIFQTVKFFNVFVYMTIRFFFFQDAFVKKDLKSHKIHILQRFILHSPSDRRAEKILRPCLAYR